MRPAGEAIEAQGDVEEQDGDAAEAADPDETPRSRRSAVAADAAVAAVAVGAVVVVRPGVRTRSRSKVRMRPPKPMRLSSKPSKPPMPSKRPSKHRSARASGLLPARQATTLRPKREPTSHPRRKPKRGRKPKVVAEAGTENEPDASVAEETPTPQAKARQSRQGQGRSRRGYRRHARADPDATPAAIPASNADSAPVVAEASTEPKRGGWWQRTFGAVDS